LIFLYKKAPIIPNIPVGATINAIRPALEQDFDETVSLIEQSSPNSSFIKYFCDCCRSTDITQPNFNPYYYLLAHKSNANFDELRTNFDYLHRTQSDNKDALITFVKNNIASFMEAVDIMKEISRIAHSMYDTDLARKEYSDKICNALNVIQRYKFLFHLPQTIERSVKREEYEKVINDLVRARTAFEKVISRVFRNIQQEIEQQIQNLRILFRQRLTEFPSSIDNQQLFIRYLYSLDPRVDSVWDCIIHQKAALIHVLHSCVVHHRTQQQQQPYNIRGHDQACHVLATAFSHLWHLIQLYLRKRLYPLSERSEEIDRTYTHKASEFLTLTKEIIQTFISIIRLNLLNRSSPTSNSTSSQEDNLYVNHDEIDQRFKTLPHCVQNCRLCVLHLVSLDIQPDFKKDLQQLMFDLRLECFQVIIDYACLEVSRLNTQETWELEYDEQLGFHTKLPNLFYDIIVQKANIIDENFFEDKEAKRQADRAVCRLLNDFASVFKCLIKDCSSTTSNSMETLSTSTIIITSSEHLSKTLRLIIILNNFSYTRRFIVPRLKKILLNYGFHDMDHVYDKIEIIYKRDVEQLLDIVKNEYFRPFLHCLESPRVHAEVYSISSPLVFIVLSRILSTLVNELSKLYSKINQFSNAGGMQACLDLNALQKSFERCMDSDTSNKLKEIISKIPDAAEHIESNGLTDMLNIFLKQMKRYLISFQDVQQQHTE
ncbi:unnamed protein product, partial [Rotaria sp. Silwood2]